MSTTEELVAAVQARAAGTPYAVERTAEGFDVRLELDDPQWFGQLRESRLTQASVHHVQVLEASCTFAVTDELSTLTWRAGADGRERPTLGAAVTVTRGRVTNRSFQRTCTVGRGEVRQTSATAFDSSAGRDLVLDAAKTLGWKRQLSLNERIGLVVGVTTIVLLVLAGIVVGVVALAGSFS